MFVGYARVSTGEQNLDLQSDALKQAGCEKIFSDQMSGAKAERPGLVEAFSFVRKGDALVVWRLDRLGRSLKDLVQRVEELQQRQVGFRSLHESIDTTSSVGKFQFHVFSALAEFERDLIRDRTLAGLRAARARGRLGGRPRRLAPEQVKMAVHLIQDPDVAVAQICRTLGVSRSTLYRYVGSILAAPGQMSAKPETPAPIRYKLLRGAHDTQVPVPRAHPIIDRGPPPPLYDLTPEAC